MIKAYYKAKLNNIKLVIAGGVEFENQYMSDLKKLCSDENVIFTGYVFGDDLCQLYTNASLYVLASRNEGFQELLIINILMSIISYIGLFLALTFITKLQSDKPLYMIVSFTIILTSIGMEWLYRV